MITEKRVREMALSFDNVEEVPHFEKISFRVKKKIFATLNVKENRATLKLSEADQSIFSLYGDKTAVYPVPNKWGKMGWTQFRLEKVEEAFFYEALLTAYCEVAPKSMAEKYLQA